jgi:hypothetical protein
VELDRLTHQLHALFVVTSRCHAAGQVGAPGAVAACVIALHDHNVAVLRGRIGQQANLLAFGVAGAALAFSAWNSLPKASLTILSIGTLGIMYYARNARVAARISRHVSQLEARINHLAHSAYNFDQEILTWETLQQDGQDARFNVIWAYS